MLKHFLRPLAALALATSAGPLLAGMVTLSGSLDDPGNAALRASDLGAAQFADDLATANNVALYALHVAVGGTVNFTSTGFGLGGIDPYFTLFSGTDQASAVFRASNYLHAVGTGGDFAQDEVLAAGDYTVAIAVFQNMSFAENFGSGFLADGFTGLGGPLYFGDGTYRLHITQGDNHTVPEPGAAWLALTATWAAWAATGASRRRRQTMLSKGGR